jgi:hypothetical protein
MLTPLQSVRLLHGLKAQSKLALGIARRIPCQPGHVQSRHNELVDVNYTPIPRVYQAK